MLWPGKNSFPSLRSAHRSVRQNSKGLTGVSELPAAWIWQCVADGCTTLDELTERLCQEYKVDAEVARRDLEKQLADWQAFGLIG